jgi:hypothetical protein
LAPTQFHRVYFPQAWGPTKRSTKAKILTADAAVPAPRAVSSCCTPGPLPGNPYDGHTPRDVIEDTQKRTGCEIERGYVDKGYRGHDAQNPHCVFISGQKRGVFGTIKRELRRRQRHSLFGRLLPPSPRTAEVLLRRILIALLRLSISRSALNPAL